jgi:acyl phosphate:glycerol-3-phosphate acyltransferase
MDTSDWTQLAFIMYIAGMPNALHIIAIALLAFLLGSLPTAWLLIRRHSGKDLRSEGSGNIGMMNAFEVSRSKLVGAAVLGIDLLKGFAASWLGGMTASDPFLGGSVAMIMVVIGHNYSPWIGWKGGRGLAAAAGAALAVNPLLLALWVLYWLLVFAKVRNIHIGNVAASVFTPATMLVAPGLFMRTSLLTPPSPMTLFGVCALLFALILIKHIEPMRELWRSRKKKETFHDQNR